MIAVGLLGILALVVHSIVASEVDRWMALRRARANGRVLDALADNLNLQRRRWESDRSLRKRMNEALRMPPGRRGHG
jgi:hypothetical protein